MMKHMKHSIQSEWEVTDLCEPNKIIGIEIMLSAGQVTISQRKYIESVLEKEGMANANPVGMPLDPNIKLVPNPEDNELNRSNAYAKLLGELQYIANFTQPDILYAMNCLGAYTANPSLQHFGIPKQILSYLVGTKDLGITYKAQENDETNTLFHRYANAAYANNDDLKSTTGYVFLSSGGAITWKSKKQTVIALSTM
jgi:hypothetical protein